MPFHRQGEKKLNVKCGKIGPKACPSPMKEGLLSRLWYGCTETRKSQTRFNCDYSDVVKYFGSNNLWATHIAQISPDPPWKY